jgi:hypothetical protein
MLIGAVTGAAVAPVGTKPGDRKAETRHLGPWRSDKERTLQHWRYLKEPSPETRQRFENIWGRLTIRFTRTRIQSEYDGEKKSTPYSVVGSDHHTVVIALHEDEGTSFQQLHFEDDAYYVVVGGYNFEFFMRAGD